MSLFKKRESLTQNIAYMAIMAAINVVFVLLTTFVPVLVVALVLVLPLTSVIVTLFCKKKYFLIYAIATIGLCILVTMWNFADTFLYVIPSILTGFAMGFMIEKKIPSIYILIVSSLIQFGFVYAFIPFIKFVLNTDIISVFINAFGLKNFQYSSYLIPTFVSFVSIAQASLAYAFVKGEIPKLGYEVTLDDSKYYYVIPLIELFLLGLFVLFIFVAPTFAFTPLMFVLLPSIYLIIDLVIKPKTIVFILLFCSLVITVFVFAFSYQYIPKPFAIAMVFVFFVLSSIIAVVNNYFFKVKENTCRITSGK